MSNANTAAPRKRRPILRAIGLVVLAFVVVYASFAIYLATRPVVSSFDAVQKFRDSLPKPAKADEAAWPAYRDALVALGPPLLLGVSRKRFVRAIDETADDPKDRIGGSLACALEGARAGVAAIRVHDVRETVQALKVWAAIEGART